MTDRTTYTILITVTKVEEGKERKYLEGIGPDAKFTEVSLGWFVTFEGSYESLFFGDTKPELEKGDKVKITFERIEK